MPSRDAHWIWMGSPPPAHLLGNISRFRAQDTHHVFDCHLWLDRAWAPPPDVSGRSLHVHRVESIFDLAPDFPALARLRGPFERERRGAFRALAGASDIARCALLYARGGLYMDADVRLTSMPDLDYHCTVAIARRQLLIAAVAPGFVTNTILAAAPRHKLLEHACRDILSRYEKPSPDLPSPDLGKRLYSDGSDNGEARAQALLAYAGTGALIDARRKHRLAAMHELPVPLCFEPLDVSGHSYRHRPALMRRDSAPW